MSDTVNLVLIIAVAIAIGAAIYLLFSPARFGVEVGS